MQSEINPTYEPNGSPTEEAPRLRRSHPGPLEASLSGISPAALPNAGPPNAERPETRSHPDFTARPHLELPDGTGMPGEAGAADAMAARRCTAGRGHKESAATAAAAAAIASAAQRLRELEARVGASVERAATGLAALGAKKADIVARQRGLGSQVKTCGSTQHLGFYQRETC